MSETTSEPVANEVSQPKKRIATFKYWADVVRWFITLIGVLVDYIKENPFPRKDDYTVN